MHKQAYKKLTQQLSELENTEQISPELINGLLNAYQELSVDYYKHNNKVSTIQALAITKEMYQINFDQIISMVHPK